MAKPDKHVLANALKVVRFREADGERKFELLHEDGTVTETVLEPTTAWMGSDRDTTPRSEFVYALNKVAHEVEADLRENVFPVYERAVRASESRLRLEGAFSEPVGSWKALSAYIRLLEAGDLYGDGLTSLQTALNEWARRYLVHEEVWLHEPKDWLLDNALFYLAKAPNIEKLPLPPSTPSTATLAVEKRSSQHFEWLVRRHVQGWTWSAIIQTYRPYVHKDALNTVRKAVGETADLVGLTLRRGSPGRPKKRTS